MTVDNESIIELTKAVELLGNNINRMSISILVAMLITLAFMWFMIKHYEKISNHSLGSFNPDKASNLYNTDKLSKLLKYCLKFHKKYPNDVQVNLYMALAHYKLGNYSEAKQWFLTTGELNPHYKDTVAPYLDEINMQSEASKSATIS